MSIRRAGEVSIALAYLMVAGMFYLLKQKTPSIREEMNASMVGLHNI
jgi:hypothetical protein